MGRRLLWLCALVLGSFLVSPAAQAQIGIPPTDIPCFVNPDQSKCREPVLIVPGLGASYNRRLMLQDRAGGTWKFAPSVDWFDPLIERLEAEGYEEGVDLFVVYYDWRQPNLQSAIQYLIPAINLALENNDPESGKVDIIAHSMGGLVARAYAQSENLYNGDVDQLLLLGTPSAGAAGSYVAWEGGKFPQNWGTGSRLWIGRIESALKKTRGQNEIRRPLSFRTFFPALKELLPIDSFVHRDGSVLNPDELAEQNDFLQELDATSDRLGLRGISVAAIAGNQLKTLATVPVEVARTLEDEALSRWRDGHAVPDPPAADSNSGDQTVLLSSAQQAGHVLVTLDNVSHEELPGMAQEQVVAQLVASPVGDFAPVHLAQAAIGIDVLSPVMPTVRGPGGEVLSSDQNTFANADFDWDPSEPDGIKVLTITDPPPGEFTVELAGIAEGDYTIIISYADRDETFFEEQDGAATIGHVDTIGFTVGEVGGDSIVIEVFDVRDLLQQIIEFTERTGDDGLIEDHERSKITRSAQRALHAFGTYEQRLAAGREHSAAGKLRGYYKNLEKIDKGLGKIARRDGREEFIETISELLEKIRDNSPTL